MRAIAHEVDVRDGIEAEVSKKRQEKHEKQVQQDRIVEQACSDTHKKRARSESDAQYVPSHLISGIRYANSYFASFSVSSLPKRLEPADVLTGVLQILHAQSQREDKALELRERELRLREQQLAVGKPTMMWA